MIGDDTVRMVKAGSDQFSAPVRGLRLKKPCALS